MNTAVIDLPFGVDCRLDLIRSLADDLRRIGRMSGRNVHAGLFSRTTKLVTGGLDSSRAIKIALLQGAHVPIRLGSLLLRLIPD